MGFYPLRHGLGRPQTILVVFEAVRIPYSKSKSLETAKKETSTKIPKLNLCIGPVTYKEIIFFHAPNYNIISPNDGDDLEKSQISTSSALVGHLYGVSLVIFFPQKERERKIDMSIRQCVYIYI